MKHAMCVRGPSVRIPMPSSFGTFAPLRLCVRFRFACPQLHCIALCSWSSFRMALSAADLAKARTLLMHGRYEEAAEIYKPHRLPIPKPRSVWPPARKPKAKRPRRKNRSSRWPKSTPTFKPNLPGWPFSAAITKRPAAVPQRALKLAATAPLAIYIKAELARTSGRIEEAERGYHRLIEFYNNHEVKKPMRSAGSAAPPRNTPAGTASATSSTSSSTNCIQALEVGRRLLARALRGRLAVHGEIQSGRRRQGVPGGIGDQSPARPEVHAAMAQLAMEDYHLEQAEASLRRAMEINPNLPEVWETKADVAWLNDETDAALRLLREKLLPLNPRTSRAGRVAACYLAIDATAIQARRAGEDGSVPASRRFDDLVGEVVKRNPHAGEFYTALAEMLQVRHKHSAAEKYFREAIRVLPRQPQPHAGLGLLLMRLGREAEARKTLQAAFDADPFHVRVKNSLDVLDVVDAMQTRRTPHFIIRYDAADSRLVPYLAPHLEKVYAELQQEFGYAPPRPTPVEVFNESQGQSGHSWFSADDRPAVPGHGRRQHRADRGAGLAGGNAAPRRLRLGPHAQARNDPRLQPAATGYNIPHWLTEGLAVYNEDPAGPYRWVLILRRRAAAGTLMNLDNVNAGFARAMEGDDCFGLLPERALRGVHALAGRGQRAQKDCGGLFRDALDGRGSPASVRQDQGRFRAGLRGLSEKAD